MGLYWHKPDGSYRLVDDVLRYRPDGMVSVLMAGDRLLIQAANLVVF